MKYTRIDYENFLNAELETQMKEYEQVVSTKALVLKERGDVFVGRFIKLQPNGIAIFKVRNSDNMPRKNTFWTASFLIGETPASYPLLLISEEEQETLLINPSDYHIHIYYHNNGQY